MEILVVMAIILVIAAIAFPVYSSIQMKGNKAYALNNMKNLASAMGTYTSQNNGTLPAEDSKGADTWQTAAKPENEKAWYNALPKLLGQKSVGDFSAFPRDFYSKQNILFLPGATYPASDKKLQDPMFAIAINTKLARKNEDGKKEPVMMSQIINPAKTVMFLEQGMPSEQRTIAVQSKKDYDGSPKGSAKSFIGRYNGQGYLTFFDGHADSVEVKETLTETGDFPFPQTYPIWTTNPESNPNK